MKEDKNNLLFTRIGDLSATSLVFLIAAGGMLAVGVYSLVQYFSAFFLILLMSAFNLGMLVFSLISLLVAYALLRIALTWLPKPQMETPTATEVSDSRTAPTVEMPILTEISKPQEENQNDG